MFIFNTLKLSFLALILLGTLSNSFLLRPSLQIVKPNAIKNLKSMQLAAKQPEEDSSTQYWPGEWVRSSLLF